MEKPALQLKRHYTEISEKETDEVVNVLADLIVNYIKRENKKPDGIHNPKYARQHGNP